MPYGGIVDLLGIWVVRVSVSGQLRVVLMFADSANRRHGVSYPSGQFVTALNRIASPKCENRLAGLLELGVYTEQRHRTPFYHIRLGNFVGSLGDLQNGAGNDLLLMLHEDSPRPALLRSAIREQREINMPNPFRQ